MIVKGITRQWDGGGYYRVRQPLDELALHGHSTSCELARTDVDVDDCDVLVGQFIGGQGSKVYDSVSNQPLSVNSVLLVHNWWRQLYVKCKLVYEMDDDPFEIEIDNPAWRLYSSPIAHDSIAHCIQVSHLVTVSTDPLAERISKINPNVVVLKNQIDESLLSKQRPKRDRLTIGWAGTVTHVKDMQECAYALRRIMKTHSDVDVHLIGADLRRLLKLPREARFTPWAMDTFDYYDLIDFDIGIAPLIPTVFAAAKSHIKALEYSALGIPVVASDSDAYRDFVIDGVTGFLVGTEHEWHSRIRDLVNDAAMRDEMGAKARELASQWTIQRNWHQWESAYRSIC